MARYYFQDAPFSMRDAPLPMPEQRQPLAQYQERHGDTKLHDVEETNGEIIVSWLSPYTEQPVVVGRWPSSRVTVAREQMAGQSWITIRPKGDEPGESSTVPAEAPGEPNKLPQMDSHSSWPKPPPPEFFRQRDKDYANLQAWQTRNEIRHPRPGRRAS